MRRDVFENEMNVSWEHPRAKKPENGYRLVFAPYSHISTQKPWYENIDKDDTSVSFQTLFGIFNSIFNPKFYRQEISGQINKKRLESYRKLKLIWH